MKLNDILKVLAVDLKTSDLKQVSALLKDKTTTPVKYKIQGKDLGPFGFTGLVKMVTEDGVKIFDVNKVRLVRFADMQSFEKARPKTERPVKVKAPVEKVAKKKVVEDDEEDFEDFDDAQDTRPAKAKKKLTAKGKAGSLFIPKK